MEGRTTLEVRYAGFWPRVVAYLIDISLELVVSLPALLLEGDVNRSAASDPAVLLVYVAFGLLSFAFVVYNRIYLVARRGQSIGKKVMGIRIVRADGRPIGGWRAVGRALAERLSWLTILLTGFGFWMVAVSPRKQALHDYICDTLVVHTEQDHAPAR